MTSRPENAEQRPCWFVGASYGGTEDQTDRFLREGIWENGWGMNGDDRLFNKVNSMRPGDRIAIKSAYIRKNGLPFDNGGKYVSTMAIKARGIITENPGDGCLVHVNWTPLGSKREWYFYTNRNTIWDVLPGQGTIPWAANGLIDFAFADKGQDYDRFLRQWGWVSADQTDSSMPVDLEVTEEEIVSDPEYLAAEPYSIDSILSEGCFLERSRLEDILEHWWMKKNLILQGPPGTGKTWLARKLAYALMGRKDDRQMQAVQFHPNLSYEDFVRGWRPAGEGRLELRDGPFLNVVDAARDDPNSVYVVVIEEINRGNPAQIFGEMLTLLEADKRREEEGLGLSYRKSDNERVFVPPNLYVIGTMNTADRSLALVDLAFRRRFAFEELEPVFGAKWREWVSLTCGIEVAFLERIERRLLDLNRQITDDKSLGRQFCIGHSFVTPPIGFSIPNASDWFDRVVKKEIGPLLDECWYDSPDTAQKAKDDLRSGL